MLNGGECIPCDIKRGQVSRFKKGAFNLHYITRSKSAAIKFLFEKIILCLHLFDFYFTALKIYFLQLYETTVY